MPRIAAASIEQHVQNQESRILAAAAKLFLSDGYRSTDMGGIAKSMGLARNSIYRYYRSKDHILVAVIRREMVPFIEQVNALAEIADPGERIDAWVDIQLELAAGPCLKMIGMLGDLPRNSHDLHSQIRDLHTPSRQVLESASAELLADSGRDPALVSSMVTSMVRAVADQAIAANSTDRYADELRASIRKIFSAA